MSKLQSRPFDEPDDILSLPNVAGQIVVLGEVYVGRYVYQPGFRWSKDVRPVVGTPSCQHHHHGVVLSGQLLVATDDGARRVLSPGEAFDIPPGHDAWVVGEEPCVTIEFHGVREWGKPTASHERVLATLLLTDIVGSTAHATRLGDAAWKDLLARHGERVHLQLDRFRGFEIDSTGDGILAVFDGAARAVRCAAAICDVARQDGIEVRAGVHSGEIERQADKIRGVAVHTVARIVALAKPSEVLVSSSTVTLLEGSGLSFSDAGEHELKGVSGRRQLARLEKGAVQPTAAPDREQPS